MMKSSKIIALFCAALPVFVEAQTLTWEQYRQSVAEKNVALLAEKYNVNIADARLQASKVFNDPELSVDYGNNQDWSKQMGQSVEMGLSYDLDIAGVRKAQMRVARSEKDMAEASLNAYLCNLRMEASEAWADAWKARELLRLMESSVKDMEQIASNDSIRLSVGDIGRTDATQSRLEAQTLRGDLIALQADYRNALLNLSYMAGGISVTGLSEENLPSYGQQYAEPAIYRQAESNRADLRVAELAMTLSKNNLRLVKASRAMDLGLNLGYSYNTEVRNEIAPAPKYNGLSVGVSIPLKFSSLNKGEVRAARQEVEQSEKLYEAACMQVRSEVARAFNAYKAARQVLQRYDGTMLKDAENILESRKVGYLKGESSILELLTARQTYNNVRQSYIDACYNCYLCEVKLQQAIGVMQ